MILKRVYLLNNIFDINKNGTYNTDYIFNNNQNYKLVKKYQVCKKIYLNINQEIINNNIHTYCEYYKVYHNKDNKIMMEYKQDILDNLEFPPLNKYDFEETYEEIEYHTKYGKLISNKYQTYLELKKEYDDKIYDDKIYDDIFNIF